jgi:hypothetical protein
MVTRQEKPDSDKGYYLDPKLYGQPETKSGVALMRRRMESSASTKASER